jgi:hypothetical protein
VPETRVSLSQKFSLEFLLFHGDRESKNSKITILNPSVRPSVRPQ